MDEQREQQNKKRRGCLVYAFIIGTVFLIFLLAGVLAGLNRLLAFTDKAPLPIPALKLSQPEVEQVRQRVDSFRQAARGGQAPQPLSLTADEANALIKTDPEFEPLRNRLYIVEIKGEQIKAQISIAMAELGAARFKERYFNGYVTFSPNPTNGFLGLKPQKIETLQGRTVPEKYLDLIHSQNIARGWGGEKRPPGTLDWIQAIEVKDGKVVALAKGK